MILSFTFYLKNLLQVPFVRVDPTYNTASKPNERHHEVCLTQPGVPHLPHQVAVMPARQVGGGQGLGALGVIFRHSHLSSANKLKRNEE